MSRETLPLEMVQQITPQLLIRYAEDFGWKSVLNPKRSDIAIFHRPDSKLHQILIPTDPRLADFTEAVFDVVQKMAHFENRPLPDLVQQILLPPSDMLLFRELSPDSETGSLSLEHAEKMVSAIRKALLSVAHSVLHPQTYYPRLSQSEAKEFINRCRLGQTERGSFAFNVACPMDLPISLPGMDRIPFTRRVTSLFMNSLFALVNVVQKNQLESLLDLSINPGISANLCETLLELQPNGDRSSIIVSSTWSRSIESGLVDRIQTIKLDQSVFALAEKIATVLRITPEPETAHWFGYVEELRGQPTKEDSRPSGEVIFRLLDNEEGEIKARGILNPDQYAIAGAAHLAPEIIRFSGILHRHPRSSRVDSITNFEKISLG